VFRFLPVEVISALFRGKFLAELKQLWRDGKLKLDGKLSHLADKRQFESWLSTLYNKNWVVYAQGPPAGVVGAEPVLKYLARYVSGVAISLIGEPSNELATHSETDSAVAVAELELLVSTEAPLCPSCRQGGLVLTETWPRSNAWLPCPATFESVVLDRPMHNTFQEFMARRQQLQPTAKPTGQFLCEDTS
jgi:hypothetical protein